MWDQPRGLLGGALQPRPCCISPRRHLAASESPRAGLGISGHKDLPLGTLYSIKCLV